MLTKAHQIARALARPDAHARGAQSLLAPRRGELLVAVLAVLIVTVIVAGTDTASAQSGEPAPDPEPAEFEATPSEPADAAEEPPADEAGVPPEAAPSEPAAPPRAARKLRIKSAKASPSRFFLGSRRPGAFRFELVGSGSRELLVKVVGIDSRQVVRRFRLGSVEAGSRQRLSWDGKLKKGGFAPEGEYAFRVYSDGQRAAVSKDSGSQRFGFYGHRFPLLGRHTYGDGFGAGRNHQGQDIFAACGTRVAAARGGRVQARSFHSAAGYYVVVDGRGIGQDYAYMHLERADRPPEGSWVSTGELVGRESDTGNASGCHLHFEIWSGPGWYEGGHPKPPTAALKRWDSWS